jgi:hypothetical protein
VQLDSLPEGLTFPSSLQDRISYDPATKRLCFEGFMSKTDFDKLIRLSNNIAYQRAMERLFQIATFADDAAEKKSGVAWLMAGVAAALATIGAVLFFVLHH